MPRQSESTLAAIKQAVDIVALVGDYLTLHRSGSKFKALCPFHDDHNPSLELNADRQSYKCWSCGAGGDIFDFVKDYERVEFPEALRMLAERAGIALEDQAHGRPSRADGPSKSELLEVLAWAEGEFVKALETSAEALAYVERRGLNAESVARFRLGFAPDARDWLASRARPRNYAASLLERAGLIARSASTDTTHDRFRGRLVFPIHDARGRPIGFGGRILPNVEQRMVEAGRHVAKYVNSPETPLFQKRRHLYAADLARPAAREVGWVAVVEGYTDVIAAHQVGLANVVGTLGTALGDDHVVALRRLADRVVLVFDGDEAGQKAAERALELFLGHEIDARVLTLPEGIDPCDYLLAEGAGPFRALVDRAVDPLEFVLDRVAERFDFESPEGARQAAHRVLEVLARVPRSNRAGLDLKVAKALDTLGRRLGLPVADLKRQLRRFRRPARPSVGPTATGGEPAAGPAVSESQGRTIHVSDLDPIDRELVQVALNEPAAVAALIRRVPAGSLRDAPLRAILQACYDLQGEGLVPGFDRVALRLGEAERALAAGLLLPAEPAPLSERARPAPWQARLAGVLGRLEARAYQERLRDLQAALAETDPTSHPDEHRALRAEYFRYLTQRPDSKAYTAS